MIVIIGIIPGVWQFIWWTVTYQV